MLKTFKFFSEAIFNKPKKTVSVIASFMLDGLSTVCSTVIPILFVKNMDENTQEIDPTDIILLSSAIVLSRLIPKIRNMVLTPVTANTQKELTLSMLEKCYDLELDKLLSMPNGQFGEALGRNYSTVDKLIPTVFGEITPFLLETIAITSGLAVEYELMGVFPVGILVIYSCVGLVAQPKLAELRGQKSEIFNQAFGKLMQAINSYPIAHQFNNIRHELVSARPVMDKTENLTRTIIQISNTVNLFQTLVNYLGLAGTFFYTASQYEAGEIKVSDLALINYLMFQFGMR